MATIVTYNGVNYTIPATGEQNWSGATKVDGLLISLAQNVLQQSGGNFTLSGDLNFGPSAGLVSLYFKSVSSNIATTGVLRLANADVIAWRNNAHTGNYSLYLNSSDYLSLDGASPIVQVNSSSLVGSGGVGEFRWAHQNGYYAYHGIDTRNDSNFRLTLDPTVVKQYICNLTGYGGDTQLLALNLIQTTGDVTSGSPTITNIPSGVTATITSQTFVFTDSIQDTLTAVGTNTFTASTGQSYPTGGGTVQDTVANIAYTYTTYTSGTGVFTGVTPDPSGVATVGDKIYFSVIPYLTQLTATGGTTITLGQNALGTKTGINLYIVSPEYGHWTLGSPGTRVQPDNCLLNLYGPSLSANGVISSTPGTSPHIMLHNNDPMHLPNGIVSILAMNDDWITGGVETGGLDFVIENHDTEGSQLGSGWIWTAGSPGTTFTATVTAVGANTFSVAAHTKFSTKNGSVTNTTRSVTYSYVTYNQLTGKFVGVTANPSGTTQVGDTLQATIPGGSRIKALAWANNGNLTFGTASLSTGHVFNAKAQFPNGTAAAPSIYFAAGSTTGFYSIGATTLGISSNGSNVGQVTSAGTWTLGKDNSSSYNFTGTAIAMNSAAVAAQANVIETGAATDSLAISGNPNVSNGGIITLFGSSHSTPNIITFKTANAQVGKFDASGDFWPGKTDGSTIIRSYGLAIKMNSALTSAAQALWYNGVDTGSSAFAGGTDTPSTTGAGIIAYGHNHASKADKLEIWNNNTLSMFWDASGILNNAVGGNESTGAGSAALGGNSPAVTNTAPYKWLKVKTQDGSTGYIPIWK